MGHYYFASTKAGALFVYKNATDYTNNTNKPNVILDAVLRVCVLDTFTLLESYFWPVSYVESSLSVSDYLGVHFVSKNVHIDSMHITGFEYYPSGALIEHGALLFHYRVTI